MTVDEMRNLIDEYARNADMKISRVERALNAEIEAILKEVVSDDSKSKDN